MSLDIKWIYRNHCQLFEHINNLYHIACLRLHTFDQGQNSLCFIDIISGQVFVDAVVKILQDILQLWDFYRLFKLICLDL